MKVYKNLMGDGSKIHVDEIGVKIGNKSELLSSAIIVAEGSSVTGRYVRYGNGLQICQGVHEYKLSGGRDQYFAMPAQFKGKRDYSVSISTTTWSDSNTDRLNTMQVINNSTGQFYLLAKKAFGASGVIEFTYLAVGFWK